MTETEIADTATHGSFADCWDLDPDTIYLNHGSFGPSPKQVIADREEWSRRLERQPMKFFCQQMEDLLEQTASDLAGFLHTKPARLALIDNATFAMNIVADSITLQAGDEVLLTDHEYGAVRNIWNQKCRQSGAKLITAQLPFPLDTDGILAAVEQATTTRTRVIVVSHVTSATAAILPVEQLCHQARQRKVLTVVDGPHAVAMLDLHLDRIGCEYYCGSCHKWLCAPFGSGFLWVHPRHHNAVHCPVVSWGGSIAGRTPCWKDRITWLGTRDPAPLLSISAAIRFLNRIGLNTFREHAQSLIHFVRDELLSMDGCGPLCTTSAQDVVSMVSVELPQPEGWQPGYHGSPDPLQIELRDTAGIEAPVAAWNGHRFLRVSAHLYNSRQDMERLLTALRSAKTLQ
ncbi:MAG: aminotransferase class V-fold PLP-dependent enzyme [Fuerstiella sp.]